MSSHALTATAHLSVIIEGELRVGAELDLVLRSTMLLFFKKGRNPAISLCGVAMGRALFIGWESRKPPKAARRGRMWPRNTLPGLLP